MSASKPLGQTDDRLFTALAEQVKLPLLQIARQAELSRNEGGDATALQNIELSATQALWFVEGYMLSQQLLQQTSLALEPLTVSAMLQDTAHSLLGLAKQYDCELELHLQGRYAPVMAHRQGLRIALLGLGSALITAGQTAGQNEEAPRPRLILAAHRSRGGTVAGIFSQADGLSQAMLQRGRQLYGRARQPLAEFTTQSGAGIYVADALFTSMQTQLRVAQHHKMSGLAATLQPSRQLALI